MDKQTRRSRRKKSIRKKVFGTADRPRMCVYKSNMYIYVQLVNDVEGRTLCGVSTRTKGLKANTSVRKNIKFAKELGSEAAKLAIEKGIKKVVFDRSGYRYHGVVKAIADEARKEGLEF